MGAWRSVRVTGGRIVAGGIALAGEDVENDVGGMNTMGRCCRKSLENLCEQ